MKIIKKGRVQSGWSVEAKCTGRGNGGGGCGAVLLVEQQDVFSTSRSYYDGSTDTFASFRCSQCRVVTDLATPPPFKLGSEAR